MKTSERKALLAECRRIAYCAEIAANAVGYLSYDYRRLRETIARQEREHRAMGRRIVGPTATRGRASIDATVDFFVARVFADACISHKSGMWRKPGERQIASLVGIREDYVKAAIMASDARFYARFRSELQRAGLASALKLWTHVEGREETRDYAEVCKP